jgi:hypothetical protein
MGKTIVLELFEEYSNQEELTEGVVHDLQERGKQCCKVDDSILLVNNNKYSLSTKTMIIRGTVLREAILKKIS